MRHRTWIVSLALVVCIGALPGEGAARVQAQANTGRTRVVHMAPQNVGVDVVIDGQRAVPDLTFRSATSYVPLAAGSHMLQLTPTGGSAPPVLAATLAVQAGQDQTFVALGLPPAVEDIVLTDDNRPPDAGMAKIRFVHAGADVPAVDIGVAGGPMLFRNVGFKGVAGPMQVPAGTYNLQVRAAGTETVLLVLPSVSVSDGQILTLFGAGLRSDNSLTVVVLPYASAQIQAAAAETTLAVAPTTPITAVSGVVAAGSGGLQQRSEVAVRWLAVLSILATSAAGLLWGMSRRT